jgi:Flp pilus assembly protein CpaB
VSRRARAVAFAAAAALCAGLAASATGGPGGDPASQLGALREVVVATEPLPGRRPLRQEVVRRALELRRVPERFVAPDALSSPAQALGRSPAVAVPAGGYLLDSQLQSLEAEQGRPRRLGRGRRPVEIGVQGAGALAAGPGPPGRRVDVVVTSEPGPGGGGGRTYVAAEAVGLIELRPGGRSAPDDVLSGPAGEAWVATLALTREQALRLIHAESFARSVRLIGR